MKLITTHLDYILWVDEVAEIKVTKIASRKMPTPTIQDLADKEVRFMASSAVSMTPSGESSTSTSSSTNTDAGRSDGEHEGGIAHFFKNLFGSDDDKHDAERAGHAPQRV